MNKCIICNKEIKTDAQFINGNWYHNNCIENLTNKKQQLVNFLRDRINYYGIFTTASKALQEVLGFINKGGKDD